MRILAWPAFANAKHNPYNSLLYNGMEGNIDVVEYSHKRAVLQSFDILHIHWPDGFINQKSLAVTLRRMAILFVVTIVAKLRGAKIVWTVHNLLPHDPHHPRLALRFLTWFSARVDGLIFLSRNSMEAYRNKYGIGAGQVSAIIPHGHYRGVYKDMPERGVARSALNIPDNKKVVLFLGLIRAYKNVDRLIEDFIAADDPDAVLVIAGSAEPDYVEKLQTLSRRREDIRLFLQFIPDDKLGEFYAAADVVVLPFRNILNSGSALLSLSYNRKIVAPAVGSLVDLRDAVGEEWVDLYNGEFGVDVLRQALTIQKAGTCNLDAFEWRVLSQRTMDFYVEAIAR